MAVAIPFGKIRHREARAHSAILCAVLWTVAGVSLLIPGPRDPSGRVKFPDFVHFYVLGRLAAAERFDLLYDADAQYRLQVKSVPASASERFLPVYGPQTALIFLPLASLPYLSAGFVWAAVTASVYGLTVWSVWRSVRGALADGWIVAAAAAAFPPFWNLILHGQTTLVPLAAYSLAWLALTRGRVFLAGLALGLLSVKPQFGLMLAFVTLACGHWSLMTGAVASVAFQAAGVALVMGPDVLVAYVDTVLGIPAMAAQLEPRPYQLHSVRVLTTLVPGALGEVLYAVAFLLLGWQASRVWRGSAPTALRLGIVIFASALASPHLTVYDATVLVLPFLWLAAWVRTDEPTGLRDVFWPLVYGLFIFFLLPSALFVGVQISVLIQLALFWLAVKELRRHDSFATVPSPASLGPSGHRTGDC
jgi:hypothetical protein